MAFKRSEWNELIDQVNQVITNPPDGCDPLPPLEHLPANSVWRKSHIRAVQAVIKKTCDRISFEPLPDVWKASILSEIRDKLAQAWCDCQPDDDCTPENVRDEHGLSFTLLSNGPAQVVSPCLGNNLPPLPLSSLIAGRTVGRPGIIDRRWTVFRTNQMTSRKIRVAAGLIDCRGRVQYLGPEFQVPQVVGIHVFCSNCDSDGCREALASAAAEITSPQNFDVYTLEIDSTHAACAECA